MQGIDTPENWSAVAQGYADKVAPNVVQPYVDEFVDRLGVESSHEVVEVAAGTGIVTEALAKRAKSVFATDYAPKMVELLDERMKSLGIDNVRAAVMDGEKLEIEDNSFDRAACSFGLMFFPDRGKGFSELSRVLRPGGRAMVAGWSGPDKFEGFALFMGAVKTALPDMPAPPAPPPIFGLANPDQFRAEMEAGGFDNVEIHHVSRTGEFSRSELWATMTSGTPPIRAIFDMIGEAGTKRVEEALHGILDQKFGAGTDVVSVTNVSTVGTGTAKG